MVNVTEQSDKLKMELRRGVIVLAVLSQCDRPQYGYSLMQTLADQGLDVEEGTLYPLLRRLEKQGLLASEWQVEDGARPRRYYRISPAGIEVLGTLTDDWSNTVAVMDRLLNSNTGR